MMFFCMARGKALALARSEIGDSSEEKYFIVIVPKRKSVADNRPSLFLCLNRNF